MGLRHCDGYGSVDRCGYRRLAHFGGLAFEHLSESLAIPAIAALWPEKTYLLSVRSGHDEAEPLEKTVD